MNVVVSAIVDPWVTTLSFVVALAMRIQEPKNSPIATLKYLLLLINSSKQNKYKTSPQTTRIFRPS